MITSRCQCQQLRRRLDIFDHTVPLSIHQESVILLDQSPILDPVCRRLTRDNDVPTMLRATLDSIGIRTARGEIRVLPVQGDSGLCGPVQGGRLLDSVVPEAKRDQLGAVGDTDIQTVGLDILGAQRGLLQLDDGAVGGEQGVAHLLDRVLALPRLAAGRARQVRHVQGGEVFGVGGAVDVFEGRLGQQVEQRAADVGEAGNDAVVHQGVAAKHERVVVDRGDRRRARRRADVRKHRRRRRVGADRVEVGVVHRRRRRLEQRRPEVGAGCCCVMARPGRAAAAGGPPRKRAPHRRVPRDAEAVDVEQPVPQADLLLARRLARHVREQLRQVVIVHLLRQTVVRRDQHVFQQTFLAGREVREPSAHLVWFGVGL